MVVMAISNRTVITIAASSSLGPAPATTPSSTFSTGTGLTKARRSSSDTDRGGPFLDGDQLDGAGDDRTQLLVGLAPPLQLSSVDHEHVDVLLADGLLGGHVVEAVHPPPCRRCRLDRRWPGAARLGWPRSPRHPWPGPLSSIAGTTIAATTTRSMTASPARSRASGSARAPPWGKATLPQARSCCHRPRNSSDSVGGW